MRFVILVLDGLRPDLASPSAMPHLAGLTASGTRFAHARSVFPSETRVATSSLLTGCRPGAHGLVANTMFMPGMLPGRALRTSDPGDLALLGGGGSPLCRRTLGEHLAAAGRSLAVVSTGSAGSAVLTHPLAERLGAFRWNVHAREGAAALRVRAARGETPPAGVPNAARIAFAADVLTGLVLPELAPDVALFWCSEPDITFHAHGLGSEPARAALGVADDVVGRVVAWRDGQADAAEIGIVVLSDHGHVTGSGRVDVAGALAEAGFDGIVVTGGGAPGFYLSDAGRAGALVDWLARQAWAGPVLGRDTLAWLGSAHARSPDLVMAFRGGEAPDGRGIPGWAAYDAADVPEGGGMHGGLHRRELATVMVMQGGPFRRGAVVRAHADLADVAPTVLHQLGLAADGMDGRVLTEAWAPAAEPAFEPDNLRLGGFLIEAVRQEGRLYPTALTLS